MNSYDKIKIFKSVLLNIRTISTGMTLKSQVMLHCINQTSCKY